MSILSLVSNGDVQRSFRACIQSSGQVQSWLTKVPVRSKNIKFGPKWVENRPFGPKQRPNEPYRLSGPIRTTPEAKNGPIFFFFGKRPPAAPGGPRRPPSLLSAQAGAYVFTPKHCGKPSTKAWIPGKTSWFHVMARIHRSLLKQIGVRAS